jgi:amidophosphoribosyltransferase
MTVGEVSDRFREECALMGVYGHLEAANLVYLGLYALQHRGQEGPASLPDGHAVPPRPSAWSPTFDHEILSRLTGPAAIGHNRYATSGCTLLKNTQPFVVEFAWGAVAHNGNLSTRSSSRSSSKRADRSFSRRSTPEGDRSLIAGAAGDTLTDRIVAALGVAALLLLFLSQNELVAVRDPNVPAAGDGRSRQRRRYRLKPALDLLGAACSRSAAGRGGGVSAEGIRTLLLPPRTALAVFEYVYFASGQHGLWRNVIRSVRRSAASWP